jgi:formylglycine-generating enzyme required for sulfatase activity
MYCNWLSSREGRQLAYRRTEARQIIKDYDGKEHDCDTWSCDPTTNGYRIPTEAEWEYAARAGSTGDFCCGSDPTWLEYYAWFSRNSNSRTWPAGIRMTNAWGLFDTHGSLWEWSNDWYGSFAGGLVNDPTGPATGTERVTRGGSYGDFPQSLRFAHRGYKPPFDGGIHGFRVLCRE